MRPLDGLRSLKLKLGVAIVAAVAVSSIVSTLGLRFGVPIWLRPIIAAVIALAMIQVLAHGMTSPLREMAAATTAMAQGDYGRRVRATSKDEVGDLARAFNEMADDLAALERLRRDLVANVAHELRTPISALQATLENVADGVVRPDPDLVGTMLRQVERLGRLVSQLLDLSQLESGAVPLDRRAFTVAAVIDQAIAEARLHAPGVALVVTGDPDVVVDGDPERIHQVVANLLENAIRHSPAGEAVEVSVRRTGPSVVLEVADRGPGIAPADAERIFDRFYRSDAARSTSDGGAGLGLAIALGIVERHGGSIRPMANHPRGCRMVVSLPLTAQETHA